MLAQRLNLECAAGHRWFAPNPQAWLEHDCHKAHGDELRADGQPRAKVERCREPLFLIGSASEDAEARLELAPTLE